MRIVFMGTPDFAAVSLQRLLDERFDVVGVFTQPDKPKNRGMKLQPSPVKEIALAAVAGSFASWLRAAAVAGVPAGKDARRHGAG